MAEIKISVKNNTPNINVSSGGKKITVDSELSATSENPVQNKAVTAALANKEDKANKVTTVSKTCTDTQYPSALAVYKANENMQIDINNLKIKYDIVNTGKVDKVSGKGLSSNDYTIEDKEKLNNLPTGEDISNDFSNTRATIYQLSLDVDYKQDTRLKTNTPGNVEFVYDITDEERYYPSVTGLKNYAEPKTTVSTNEYAAQICNIGENNQEMRCITDMQQIHFVFPDGEYDTDYMQGLTFKSGATPTHISYAATGIIQWIGTDCFISDDNKSVFKPSANTQYDIVFYYNGGNYIVGCVNGYKVTTGNQEANA